MSAAATTLPAPARLRRPWFKRVDRLIAGAVLGMIALSWGVIVSLDALRIFVGELGDIGQGHYTLGRAALYVAFTVPRRVYEMFGYAALIGALLGLGGLANSGELTALRAAGLSRLRICASVALSMLLLTAGVVVLGETLGPWGERRAQQVQLAAKSSEVALAKGVLWARDGSAMIGARTARAHGTGDAVQLDEVRMFEFEDDGRLRTLSTARKAIHADGRWTLHEVRRTVFGPDSAASTTLPTEQWRSSLEPSVLQASIVRPCYMNLRDLQRNIVLLDRNQQDAGAFRSAYWARMFYPLAVLVPALCALPFAFGTLRSGGLSKRLLLGIVIALGFYLLQRSTINIAAVYDVHPALANLLPPLILAALAAAWFRHRA